jgi:ABC-type branched-subunit amino acid transport system substrate-binding protein
MKCLSMKRNGLICLVTAVTLTAATACASSAKSSTSNASHQTNGTITLGMIAPLSGPDKDTTTEAKRGIQAAFNQINAAGGVRGGKKLALKVVNEPKDPAGSVAAMRKLGSQETPIVFGDVLTPDCKSAAPVAQSLGILDISPGCAGSTLTGPNRKVKSFFSSAGSDAMAAYALAHVLPRKYPKVSNLYLVGYDYLPGHETWNYIKKTWKAKRPVNVRKQYFVPTSQQDFRTIISSLASSATAPPSSQGLVLTTYGAGNLAFLQEAKQAGLLKRFKFIATTFMYYEPAVSMKGSAPKVLDSYSYVYWGLHNNPVNKKFIAAYQKVAGHDKYPSDWAFQGYIAAQAAARALNKVKTVNLSSLVKALEGMTVNGPTGKFQVSAKSHQFLVPMIVAELGGDPSSPDKVKAYSSETIPGKAANSVSFK